MRTSREQRAVWLLDHLLQNPGSPYTQTELCRAMKLRRSPYALAIIHLLEDYGILCDAGETLIQGIKTRLLGMPPDEQRNAEILMSDLVQALAESES